MKKALFEKKDLVIFEKFHDPGPASPFFQNKSLKFPTTLPAMLFGTCIKTF